LPEAAWRVVNRTDDVAAGRLAANDLIRSTRPW
jgi:hypothetical protein